MYFGTDSTPDTDEFRGEQISVLYDPGTLSYNTTYYWRIDEKNSNGTTTGDVWSFATQPESGTGTGLRGEYYDNIDFTALVLTRTDATVDFDWGSGSPDPSIGADTFSIRWTGQVEPLYSETYTFETETDDGVRLWVDDQLIIERWVDQAPTKRSGMISLTGGAMYDIRMDYYENGGGAVARLRWSSASQAYEIIPQSQLYDQTGPPDTTPPAAPTGLTATPGDAQVSLDWDDNSEPDLAGYDAYRSTNSGGPYNVIAADLTSSDYVDNTVSNGTTYYYVITAIDTSQNESDYSNEDSATPQAPPYTDPPTPNPATWAVPGNPGGTDSGWTTDPVYNDTGLNPSTQYTYTVQMRDAVTPVPNVGTVSSPAGATTDPAPAIPAAPSSLSATPVSQTQIDLDWTDNADNETGFKIERSKRVNTNFKEIATVGADVTSFSDTTVRKNTLYYYRVRATNAYGDSDYSNEASARTPK
ncbi:MAG: PA14 domain-containing protein [Planctomycetota bacterium]